jgi:signal transduction histidine kinase
MADMLDRYEGHVRATERMRTLAVLGGGIAHQLRNSATGCQIALDLHAEQCPDARDRETLQVAKRQLRLMEEYLQRFLQLGKQPEEQAKQIVDLAALVDDTLPLVQPAARHARIDLQWICHDRPCRLTGNAPMLTQLVINLLTNAFEAAAQASAEIGRPARVTVDLRRSDDGFLRLGISDSGTGPSASVRQDLFEPFVSDRRQGIGLGLAVAHEIVEFHGGTIDFEHREGTTQFTVELPRQAAEPEENQRVHAISR